MDQITKETRIKAYEESRSTASTRRVAVYQALKETGPMTAEELADELYRRGMVQLNHRSVVAPRLTELKEEGKVKTCGKRPSQFTGKLSAVWQATEEQNDDERPI